MKAYNRLEIIDLLEKRFNTHMHRHQHFIFDDIKEKLLNNEILFHAVSLMEQTGGEPDVTVLNGIICYVDFSKETPEKRRNLCYDEQARLSRKKFPPETSAEKEALEMGIELLSDTMYKELQEIEPLDLKTSSWLMTPEVIRNLGGALFGDRRYSYTFIYHNGADSYYGVRGFRGFIPIK